MRSGTLNVPGIVGLGKACELCRLEMAEDTARISKMRDRLERELLTLEESYINGNTEHRLPHVSNMSFKYVEGEGLIMGVKDIAVSSGSACTSASLEPSYVLKALGLDDELAHSSLNESALGNVQRGHRFKNHCLARTLINKILWHIQRK